MSGFHPFSPVVAGSNASGKTFWRARACAKRGDTCLETNSVSSKEEAQTLADRLNAGEKDIELLCYSGW